MSKYLLAAICAAGIIAVPTMAYAQPAGDDVTVSPPVPGAEPADVTIAPDPVVNLDVGETIYSVVKDVRAGDWRHAAVGVLLLLMFGLRRFRDKLKIFSGDRGGSILVMLLALGGALTTTLATDHPIDLKMFLSTAVVAFTAVGGYTWVKKVIWPKD